MKKVYYVVRIDDLLLFILILQVKFHYKLNNDYTIIQTENTKDKKIPDYINKKYPGAVINKLVDKEHVLFNLSIDILYSMCRGKFANFNIQDDDPNNYKKPTFIKLWMLYQIL